MPDPRLMSLSTNKRKRLRRSAKEAQGYEQSPPTCISCEHYVAPSHGVPGRHAYRAPHCGIGHFAVDPGGICDLWLGHDGDTLE